MNHETIPVLGIDPGFANCGFCIADIDIGTMTVIPHSVEVLRTKGKSGHDLDEVCIELLDAKNRKPLQSYDDYCRLATITQRIRELESDRLIVFAEMPSTGAKNHNAAKGLAYALALVSCVTKPLVQLQPLAVKKAFLGDPQATKDEMINEAISRHPDLNWPANKQGKPLGYCEHAADALAVLYAGLATEQFERILLDAA